MYTFLFLLVMPSTAPEQAMAAMERFRRALQRTSFDDLAPDLVVTFSAGVSPCADTHDLEAAIARADAAIYDAKHAGRDRVVVCAQVPSPQGEAVDGVAIERPRLVPTPTLHGRPVARSA